MKPMEFWNMEAVFIFTGIVILLVAGAIVYLATKAIQIGERKQDPPQEPEEDPCDSCPRWSECNGVDKDCPRRDNDGK